MTASCDSLGILGNAQAAGFEERLVEMVLQFEAP